jgi:hypothetical protein
MNPKTSVMKKFLLLTVLLFFISSIAALAYEPIPSYKVPIMHHQNFLEKRTTLDGDPAPKGKRDMNIQSSASTNGKPTLVIVWVYSQDGRDILGPYYIMAGQLLTVPVDEREWGVFVICDDHVYISVYTTESAPETDNRLPGINQPFQNSLLPAGVMKSFYNC